MMFHMKSIGNCYRQLHPKPSESKLFVLYYLIKLTKFLPLYYKFEFDFRIQPTTRNEPSLQVSEFHLLSGQQTTNVDDLTNAIKKKAPLIRQKIQVASASKKLLQKPLDKVHAEKVISTIFKYIHLILVFIL